MKFYGVLLLVALSVIALSESFNPLVSLRYSFGSLSRLSMLSDGTQAGRVTMYKKEGCPYCAAAKQLLEEKHNLQITYVDIESPQRYHFSLYIHEMFTYSNK